MCGERVGPESSHFQRSVDVPGIQHHEDACEELDPVKGEGAGQPDTVPCHREELTEDAVTE